MNEGRRTRGPKPSTAWASRGVVRDERDDATLKLGSSLVQKHRGKLVSAWRTAQRDAVEDPVLFVGDVSQSLIGTLVKGNRETTTVFEPEAPGERAMACGVADRTAAITAVASEKPLMASRLGSCSLPALGAAAWVLVSVAGGTTMWIVPTGDWAVVDAERAVAEAPAALEV